MAAITPQQIALAAEAFNRAPGLSPIARRLGLELVNRSDRNNGGCRPSEARLALSLGCCDRSINRAKAELQAAGFLVWDNPGHHKRSRYQIAWSKLVELAKAIKKQIREATIPARVATHRLAVKARRIAMAKPRELYEFARTKMSGNRTTHIQTIFSKAERRENALAAKASERLWRDVYADASVFQAIERISEGILDAALQAEQHQFGSGIVLVRRHLALEGGAGC
jgi:hypothetical protein